MIRFLEAVDDDQELFGRCKVAADLEAMIGIAAEAGYEFTAEDVRAVGAWLEKTSAEGELGDEDLDAVVGGGISGSSWGNLAGSVKEDRRRWAAAVGNVLGRYQEMFTAIGNASSDQHAVTIASISGPR